MFVRYNYALKPTPEQEQQFLQAIGANRWTWNYFLAKEMASYQQTGKFNFYHANAAQLPYLKKSPEIEWLKQTPSQSLQQTLRDLETALKQSFKTNKNKRGFPRFKKRKEFEGSFRLVQTPALWKFDSKSITLPKIGAVKWVQHRKLPSDFSTATISRNGNKWQISIVVQLDEKEPVSIERHDQIVGIDLNSRHLVVTSDGEVVDNPKFLKKQQKRLKLRQRQLSKLTKNSKRRKRKHLQLRKIHTKIANQRRDFQHQVSNQITNEYDLIGMETLNVAAMQKFNGHMVQDAGWSLLQLMIEYKARLRGKWTQKIEQFAPSSKTCNTCGHQEQLTLADRTFACSHCGVVADRDINAALNIRDWAISDWINNQQNTHGTWEINGRGDTNVGEVDQKSISRYVSMNRQKFLSSRQEAASLALQ